MITRRPARYLCFAVCSCLLPGWACAADSSTKAAPGRAVADERSKQVDEIVHKYIHADGPGMAVLVVKEGSVVHKKGYGLADLAKKVPITPQTTFELASVSKQFTALAIMLLHDRERLAFDDDVRKLLPALPQYNAERPIRIRDLLNHTSGIADYMDFKETPAKNPDFPTNEEVFRELVKRKKLRFPSGSKYEYSNTGYLLLALIVERASKKSYGTFLHDEIFAPTGMKDTVAFENRQVVRRHRCLGYERKEGLPPFNEEDEVPVIFRKTRPNQFQLADSETVLVGDGSIWSNLEDMARWDAAVREGKLAKPETWKQAFTNLKLDNGKKPAEKYGFGWGLSFKKGKLVEVSHGGAWVGFGTNIRRDLTKNVTTVILCNIDGFGFDMIDDAIHEIYAGE